MPKTWSQYLALMMLGLLALNACASKQPATTPAIVLKKTKENLLTDFVKTGDSFTGKASWYGREFHGRRTACGEIFDAHAMTTAHRRLPFGTYLLVTNVANNKKTIVRVNDRGPFAQGRVLDLSHAAAKKLGYIAQGETQVTAEVLEVKNKPVPTSLSFDTTQDSAASPTK